MQRLSFFSVFTLFCLVGFVNAECSFPNTISHPTFENIGSIIQEYYAGKCTKKEIDAAISVYYGKCPYPENFSCKTEDEMNIITALWKKEPAICSMDIFNECIGKFNEANKCSYPSKVDCDTYSEVDTITTEYGLGNCKYECMIACKNHYYQVSCSYPSKYDCTTEEGFNIIKQEWQQGKCSDDIWPKCVANWQKAKPPCPYPNEVDCNTLEETNLIANKWLRGVCTFEENQKCANAWINRNKCSYPSVIDCDIKSELDTIENEWKKGICSMNDFNACIGKYKANNPSCTAEWKCDGSYKYYQDSNCQSSNKEYCQDGCENGICKPYVHEYAKGCINNRAVWLNSRGEEVQEIEDCWRKYKCNESGTYNPMCFCHDGKCGENCLSHSRVDCCNVNDVCYYDSCGNQEELIKTCIGNKKCVNGKCVDTTPCTPSWGCGSWSSCSNGKQTRTCTDTKCGTGSKTEIQSCTSKVYSGKYPVILIHGWAIFGTDNTGGMNELQRKLDSDGYFKNEEIIKSSDGSNICPNKWNKPISVNFEYYSNGRDKGIETYGNYLKNVIDTVKYCTGSDKVILIAHSMGGLVARAYITKYGSSNVDKLITLATPHYGANPILTEYQHDVDIKDMNHGSIFLNWINTGDCTSRQKYYSIGAHTWLDDSELFTPTIYESQKNYCSNPDWIEKKIDGTILKKTDGVVPIESTRLEWANYEGYEVDSCSHCTIALNAKPINSPSSCPRSYEYILKALGKSITSSTPTGNVVKETTNPPPQSQPTTQRTKYCCFWFLWCWNWCYK